MNSKTKTKLNIITLFSIFLLILVFVGTTFSLMTAELFTDSSASYGLASTGAYVENTTLSYPIQYNPGSINREIIVKSLTKNTQLLRVKIELYYVNASNVVQSISTKNVNIINRMQDWYVVETKDVNQNVTERYAYLLANNFSTQNLDEVVLISGVEFIESTIATQEGETWSVAIDTSYNSNLYLVIKTTPEYVIMPTGAVTTANTWATSPQAWLDFLNGTTAFNLVSGSSTIGKTEIYNFRTGGNTIAYLSDSFRAPVYVRNASNTDVALEIAIGIVWSNPTQYINNVKLRLKNSSNYFATSASGGGSVDYVYFYKYKLGALELVDIMDSFEIINHTWDSQTYTNVDGSPCTLSFTVTAKTVQLTETDFSELSATPPAEWLTTVNANSTISSVVPYSLQDSTNMKPEKIGVVANTSGTGGTTSAIAYNTPSILENTSSKTYTIAVKYTPKFYLWAQDTKTGGQYVSLYANETYTEDGEVLTLDTQTYLFTTIATMQTSNEWQQVSTLDSSDFNHSEYYFIYNGIIKPGESVSLYESFEIESASVITASYVEDYMQYHGTTFEFNSSYNANLFFVLEPTIQIIENFAGIAYTKEYTALAAPNDDKGTIKIKGTASGEADQYFDFGVVEDTIQGGVNFGINKWITFIANPTAYYSGEVLNPTMWSTRSIPANASICLNAGVKNNTDVYKLVKIYANVLNASGSVVTGTSIDYDNTIFQYNAGGYYEFINFALAPNESIQFVKGITNSNPILLQEIKIGMSLELVDPVSYTDNRTYREYNSTQLAGLAYNTGNNIINLSMENLSATPKNLKITIAKTWLNTATVDTGSTYTFVDSSMWTTGTTTSNATTYYYNGVIVPDQVINILNGINVASNIAFTGKNLYLTLTIETADAYDGNYSIYSFVDWRATAPTDWKSLMANKFRTLDYVDLD